jgi:hypothetical protein
MEFHKSLQEATIAAGQNIQVGSLVGRNVDFQTIDTGSTKNAEFFGDPQPWHEYEATDKKEAINIIDELIDRWQKDLDAQNNATTPEERAVNRKRIEGVVLKMVDRYKGNYADLKKALVDVNIESISDNYPFDDHFDEKYGGIK